MKNVLSFKKFSLKAVLMGFIVLFGTFPLIPNNMIMASLPNIQSLDNNNNPENPGTDSENPDKSNDTNHKDQEYFYDDCDRELGWYIIKVDFW